MPFQARPFTCVCWLALASVLIVALDGAPTRALRVPALERVAGASTAARPAMRAILVEPRTHNRMPLDLVPLAGFPLSSAERDSIVRLALTLIGTPYHFGGASPDVGFDCSGLVTFVLARLHVQLPRRAWEQATVGDAIERTQLRPGDLLTFGRDSISHVGIYIGAGEFVHASSVAGRVIVSRLDRPVRGRVRPLHGARRLLVVSGGAASVPVGG